jgi:peptidoglycan/xylan/chitin deacetylase (PgdA/CDA1 family)
MRGVITLVFDDGYQAVYKHVLPLLDEMHMSAVFALPLNTTALAATVSEPLRPWQEWLSVRQRGHEIAAHSINHADLRQLPAQKLQQELQIPHDTLPATTLVYPGGAYNDTVVTHAKKYYTAARTTIYGFESIPATDPWQLKTVDYTRDNFSLFKANARAVWVALTGRWLIETFHMIDPASGGVDKITSNMHHSVPFTAFKKHLQLIHQLPINVKTINEVIRDSHN